jgi:hypothetical protein
MSGADPRQMALLLEQALDRVQDCLQRGMLSQLTEPAAQIADLLPRIAGLDDLALAQRLKTKAARNEACLAASARGVRAARRRLTEVAAARTGLSTYDGQGRRAAIQPVMGQLTQRL